MQQNYNQTRFQRPRRLSKRPVPPSANPSPQSRLRRPPAGLASDYPTQARIRLRKAACGDHPAGLASDHPPQAQVLQTR